MIWLIIPMMFMGITFMLTTYRISMMTGMPIIHAVRQYYGKWAAGIVGVATFLSCLFFTMGNITDSGAGINLVFGLNWKAGSLLMIAIILVCYFTKGVYSKVEKIITLCILGMIICFYATLAATGGPVWGELGSGLIHWKVADGSLSTALAYVSTNAAITAGIYGTYLGVEKKWKKEDLFNGIMAADAVAHVLAVVLISGAIVLVGAIVLHPQGTAITAPAQLGDLLVPFLGKTAPIVMGIGSPTQLIFIANIATAIVTPFGGFFVCRMIFRSDVNGDLKPPRVLQVCMVISYVFALVMTGSALMNYVPKLFGI